jgi:hypothetical protein
MSSEVRAIDATQEHDKITISEHTKHGVDRRIVYEPRRDGQWIKYEERYRLSVDEWQMPDTETPEVVTNLAVELPDEND